MHDERQRVLDPFGAPIAGLYAAGELGSAFGTSICRGATSRNASSAARSPGARRRPEFERKHRGGAGPGAVHIAARIMGSTRCPLPKSSRPRWPGRPSAPATASTTAASSSRWLPRGLLPAELPGAAAAAPHVRFSRWAATPSAPAFVPASAASRTKSRRRSETRWPSPRPAGHLRRPTPLRPLETLARGAGLSAYHFHRIFKAHTGLTPKAYGEAARARRAAALLATEGEVAPAAFGRASRPLALL